MDWLLVHSFAIGGLVTLFCVGTYFVHRSYCGESCKKCNSDKSSEPHLNKLVKKDQGTVVDYINLGEIGSRDVLVCRCWLSEKFPYCDGTHRQHNNKTGDNVGPLILKPASE